MGENHGEGVKPSDKVKAKELVSRLRSRALYWASKNVPTETSTRDRIEGCLHSILVVLDGMDDGNGGYDIYKDDECINKGVMLHDLL